MGLWITNKLVGIMKGTIRVKSEVNKGTAFIISIPVMAEYASLFQSENKTLNMGETPTSSRHRQEHYRIATIMNLNMK